MGQFFLETTGQCELQLQLLFLEFEQFVGRFQVLFRKFLGCQEFIEALDLRFQHFQTDKILLDLLTDLLNGDDALDNGLHLGDIGEAIFAQEFGNLLLPGLQLLVIDTQLVLGSGILTDHFGQLGLVGVQFLVQAEVIPLQLYDMLVELQFHLAYLLQIASFKFSKVQLLQSGLAVLANALNDGNLRADGIQFLFKAGYVLLALLQVLTD